MLATTVQLHAHGSTHTSPGFAWLFSCFTTTTLHQVLPHNSPLSARFDLVRIEVAEPPSYSRDSQYLLTCVDRFILWPGTTPLADIIATGAALHSPPPAVFASLDLDSSSHSLLHADDMKPALQQPS